MLSTKLLKLLAKGNAVGLMNRSRMEFGPRALGASIIADPRSKEQSTKTLNLKVKFRVL